MLLFEYKQYLQSYDTETLFFFEVLTHVRLHPITKNQA